MLGLEVLGAVLGAYPILIDAADIASGYYQGAKTWWKFDTEFHNFVMDVRRESIAFSQIIEILVDSFQDLSREEREALQNCPGTKLWQDERVQRGIERRISVDSQRRWFVDQLQKLNVALEELCAMLPVSNVRKEPTLTRNSLTVLLRIQILAAMISTASCTRSR